MIADILDTRSYFNVESGSQPLLQLLVIGYGVVHFCKSDA